ncbi:cell wall-binding repeat-containing protein [Euzebya sp.]|uniref:cell wall-binding repeat-containing protein n=1 Tax=Euzebya sp. TaxID=1971409 RepID=UPI0035133851
MRGLRRIEGARRHVIATLLALIAGVLAAVPSAAQDEGATLVDFDIVEGDVSVGVQTSIMASRAAFDAADTVLLATSADGADALASGVLQDESPLLYVDPAEGVTADHTAELERLGAETVVIIGGEAAVSADVEAAISDAGYTVERLAGPARIETANAVAAYEDTLEADTAVHVSRAFGTEDNPDTAFADAAGLGAWAADSGVVTVLTQTDAVPAATGDVYEANPQVTTSVAIGGEAAVSDDVLSTLSEEYGQDTATRVFSEASCSSTGSPRTSSSTPTPPPASPAPTTTRCC